MATKRWASAALAAAVIGLAPVAAAPARTPNAKAHGGPLSGTWTGLISRSGATAERILIQVNAAETRGTWQLGAASCHGTLTLQSISGGYHHYLRHLAAGATCAGGDVDCLMPEAGGIYDSVTSHLGGAYDTTGKLKRVRA